MKRYVRASFDSSMPDWLKRKFTTKYAGTSPDAFVKRYGIALSDAKFSDTPTANSVPIYLLNTDYGTEVYIPGVNDDSTAFINGRQRKLGGIAKSKLADMAQDIVYVDKDSAPLPKDHGYKDPRMIYDRYSRRGEYGGQIKNWKGEWTDYRRGNSERLYRDKSGYQIPSPESKIERYYLMFPEKVTEKVDALYERLIEVKDKILSPDLINSPYDRDESMSVSNAIYRLNDAITEYRNLLATLDKTTGRLKGDDEDPHADWYRSSIYRSFSDSVKKISSCLNDAEKFLTSRW